MAKYTQSIFRAPFLRDRFVPFFFTALAISVAHRAAAIRNFESSSFRATYNSLDRFHSIEQMWSAHSSSILLGFSSDILFAGVLAASLAMIAVRRWIGLLAFAVLIFFLAANYEHIKYNFSHINLFAAGNALSPTFVAGQTTAAFAKMLAVLSTSGILIWYLMHLPRMHSPAALSSGVLLAVALALPIKFSHFAPEWMQTHPLLPRNPGTASSFEPRTFAELEAIVPPLIPSDEPKYNVLLVFLEGLSLSSIELGNMTEFARLAEANISFSRYFGNQIITVNGLYSAFTGDFPNFNSKRLKWNNIDPNGEIARNSVPMRMKEAGYHTAFLQSAPLGYMNKDTALRSLGFIDIRGLESWGKASSRNGWGIDDRALFLETLEYIDGLDNGEPWFISILTSGTHSPYNVPKDFMVEEPDRRRRALAYLDESISEIMRGLEARGLIDETVVIFTADESRERSFENPLRDNMELYWLPLVVVHPSEVVAELDYYIEITRFPEILSALIGKLDPNDLSNLEIKGRPILFGQPYTNRITYFDQSTNELFLCRTPDYVCAVFEEVEDILALDERQANRVAHFPMLREVISKLEFHK